MPLPSHPFIIHGGCNCHAIRYRISVPEISSRPLHPYSPTNNPAALPLVTTDHCNDCRTATGSIIPTWICVPANMLSISTRPAPPPNPEAPKVEHNDGPWVPALEALKADGSGAQGSTLRFYASSPKRTRTFCGHCGTNLTYAIFPMVEGWPDLFDTVLGTVDRSDLEKEWMAPERQCWWSRGVPWVKRFVDGGLGVPKHPTVKLGEVVEGVRGVNP